MMISSFSLQISSLYNRTVLTFILKMLTRVSADCSFEFQLYLNCRNTAVVLSCKSVSSRLRQISLAFRCFAHECKGFRIFHSFSVMCNWDGDRLFVSEDIYYSCVCWGLMLAAEAAAPLSIFTCICYCV
ncbi:hypothetical protein EWB00_007182 [Schistosoma japonicum]|uniref:Uncharacterized protein n=1 Tax=Schistosoma japonicum TaxID=6182 RepID=A0A4Z2CVR7_SCHJA|nr:hypothetical protein EWB00_007182 [Schistosoma japonicum]